MEKIAIVNSVLDYGSTGTLARQLFEYGMQIGHDIYVFYGRGERKENKNLIRIESKFCVYFHKFATLLTGYQGCFSKRATKKLLKRIETEKINKVILLNLHGYYLHEERLLTYLKNNRLTTVYITPDEYAGMGKCCYSKECDQYKTECKKCPNVSDYPRSIFFDRANYFFKMKKKAYNEFDKLTIVGPESNLIKFKESSLLHDKAMRRASWGIDLDLYKYELDEDLYSKYRIPKDKIIILTVAKFSDTRKGVQQYFFELARRFEGSDYHFINVGYDGNLKNDEMPSNMTTIGYMDDQKELSHIYSLSDVYLLASATDTMPVSCLISFACETPVACFYTSGLKYLADESSPAIHYCKEINIEALEQTIKSTTKKDVHTMKECRQIAERDYSKEAFNRIVFDTIEEK